MNIENAEFGARIRALREFQHLSREALAEKANISTQFLADIESGKKGMTVFTLKKICNALSATSDSIVYGSQNSKFSTLIAMLDRIPLEKRNDVEQILQLIIKNIQS